MVDSEDRVEAVVASDFTYEARLKYQTGPMQVLYRNAIHPSFLKRMVDYINSMTLYESVYKDSMKDHEGQALAQVTFQ